jgi:hypothetical protein
MSDALQQPIIILREIEGETELALVRGLLEQCGLAGTMIEQLTRLVPDTSRWRLYISGDPIAAVNELESRDDENSYTTDRGSGTVGARTICQDDGSYDIVIWDGSLYASDGDLDTAEEVVEQALKNGKHLALHEAGHMVLHERGEDGDAYENLATGTLTERAWRKHLAIHLDDHRIELMTRRDAPSPLSQTVGMADAIEHFRSELNAASGLWGVDNQVAELRSLEAANSLIRVMAYLSAELGTTPDGQTAIAPADPIEGWGEYISEGWQAWSLNFQRVLPADEPMPVADIAAVLSDLCRLTPAWLDRIGLLWEMTDLGTSIYWTKEGY